MGINPNYCDSECNCGQCEEPYWTREPRLCDLPHRHYIWDEKNLVLLSRDEAFGIKKKVVRHEERDRFMKEQLKIVSEMGRKFYKRRENTNELKRENRQIL